MCRLLLYFLTRSRKFFSIYRCWAALPRFWWGVIACCFVIVAVTSSCSTKKNTASSRFWHAFTARYNTFFNGNEAYKAGIAEQRQANKDNYTNHLPVFSVANEATRSVAKSQFELAITKCEKAIQLHSIKRRPTIAANKQRTEAMKAYLKREEYNPFLKNAWLLMGRAQFQMGSFIEAASTFSYITRHYAAEPSVAAEARAWQARCYTQLGWFFDAEEALRRMSKDSLSAQNIKEYAVSMADLLVRQERFEEALPYLHQAVKTASTRWQRARLHYLLGQVYRSLDRLSLAQQHFKKAQSQSSVYELTLNARIAQTETLSTQSNSKQMLKRLRAMARSTMNKPYLDQIYYAIGNIHLVQKDTALAITAYEEGRQKAARSGIEKGVLLFRLGSLYWERRRFDRAQICYSEAANLLGKTHENYPLTMQRTAVLDRLVPHTNAVMTNDSLLALVTMPEKERLAVIDKAIVMARQRQRDSLQAAKDQEARKRAEENGISLDDDESTPGITSTQPSTKEQASSWYFYNPTAVQQGKQTFAKEWGKRKLEDHWRRRNKSLLQSSATEMATTTTPPDTTTKALEDTVTNDTIPQLDPFSREYYLAQLPFSEEAKAAAHLAIQQGLYQAGLIEKDDLADFPLAANTLLRLEKNYPLFAEREELLRQLFLLYTRWGRPETAERFRQQLVAEYPEGKAARQLLHPNFDLNLRYGLQREDSIYTATYAAFRQKDWKVVAENVQISSEEFPEGINRAKFLLLDALSFIGRKSDKEVAALLRHLVTTYPGSDVAELAAHVVKGIEGGRSIKGGFDTSSLWARRTEVAKTATLSSQEKPAFTAKRQEKFLLLAGFEHDTINENLLLYDWATFNFTHFVARNFDISKFRKGVQVLFTLSGFRNYDEAHIYVQRVFRERNLANRLRRARIILISEKNYDLIGTAFTIEDYQKFYDRTFAPLKINPALPLDEPDILEQKYEDIPAQPELPKRPTTLPKDSTATLPPAPATTAPASPLEEEDGEIVVPIEPIHSQPAETPVEEIPAETPAPTPATPTPPPAPTTPSTEVPAPQPTTPPTKTETPTPATPPRETPATPTEEDDGEWYPV